MELRSKGILLALLTAIVSGFSIFINKFAIATIEPFTFTTAKNVVVAVLLLAVIFCMKDFKILKSLSQKQWLQLVVIGLVGGSVAFLIYFWALKQTSAINAGFIHKTLFVWASLLALFFLKERLNARFVFGAALLMAGNYLLLTKFSSFVFADIYIIVATILWAIENVIAKYVLKDLNGKTVAFGRMFFGSIFMLIFLAVTGNLTPMAQLTIPQLEWIIITSGFLFLYVLFWYSGLKYVEVSVATAILVFGQVVTGMLSAAFAGQTVSFNEAIGFFLILLGTIAVIGFSYTLSLIGWKGISLAKQRN